MFIDAFDCVVGEVGGTVELWSDVFIIICQGTGIEKLPATGNHAKESIEIRCRGQFSYRDFRYDKEHAICRTCRWNTRSLESFGDGHGLVTQVPFEGRVPDR